MKENGDDMDDLQDKVCGLRGSGDGRIENYYEDLQKTILEMHRVLKPNKFCAIIMGRTTLRGKELRHDEFVLRTAKETGFEHVLTIRNLLMGKNTMSVRHEYVLVFGKPEK